MISMLQRKGIDQVFSMLLFPLLLCLPLQVGCERINKDWHSYEKRKFEIFGPDKDQLKIVSDRWKITKKIDDDDENGEYEWRWEIKIRSEGPDELELRHLKEEDPLGIVGGIYYLKEIRYTLYSKEGSELISDILENRYIEYGTIKLFSHTGRISKSKALEASQSSYKIITTRL